VENPCTPTASAIASNDLMFGNGGSDKLCGFEGNDPLNGGKGDDYLIGVWEMIFSAAALGAIALF
jgi:Ca2+-binding RTX toxin-like protein